MAILQKNFAILLSFSNSHAQRAYGFFTTKNQTLKTLPPAARTTYFLAPT